MASVNIAGLDKAQVLEALHRNSRSQGMSVLHDRRVSLEDCQKAIKSGNLYFDYFAGRVIKCDLSKDEFDSWGYDRDNGEGAAQNAINALKH